MDPLENPESLMTSRRKRQREDQIVYYQSIKRELNIRLGRLKVKSEGPTRLTYAGFREGLEHLKIETRLTDERFTSVRGECEIVTLKVHRLYLEFHPNLPPWEGCYHILN
jgi:hypothetical protein